jgi:RNA polymerase sigma-70 factor (ECF subfamily)
MEIKKPKSNTDFELIRKAKEGDQVSFTKLMEQYRQSVYFMILKMIHNRDDADDILMITFSKAFNNIQSYSEDFAFSTWLFKIASHNCIDFIRKKKLQITSLDGSQRDEEENTTPLHLPDKSEDPEETIIKQQKALKLRAIVDKLSPKYRQLIEMRYFEELSYDEIAEKTDLPIGTVKAQLFRAKDLLYQLYNPSKDKY